MLYFGRLLIASFVAAATLTAQAFAADLPKVEFKKQSGRVEITVGGKPFATYVYADPKISRPYFAHVHASNGTQVTRNHPLVAGQDKMDHPEFHPGIWLAFGDISGNDYWRLKARVKQSKLKLNADAGELSADNQYFAANNLPEVVCDENCRFQILPTKAGTLLTWDSTFTSPHEFTFGDQEEMGLGIRVATPLRVEVGDGSLPAGNGTMIDSAGRKNGEQIGGKSADWCDYSGTLGGEHVGMTIFCHPENFRPSWFHARDYGFLAANAFGRAAFKHGEPSKIVVKPGESLRLRYGILVHSGDSKQKPDLNAAYQEYVSLTKGEQHRAAE
jgi:hypothetical protein